MEPNTQIAQICLDLALSKQKGAAGLPYTSSGAKYNDCVVFNFSASTSAGDWDFVTKKSDQYPSMKVIGSGDVGKINQKFADRFTMICSNTGLVNEVNAVLKVRKRVVFTGHSDGGALAIIATIWLLDSIRTQKPALDPSHLPCCVTFGAPLVGDKIVGHAIRRENWASLFKNYVLGADIVPRVSLAILKDSDGTKGLFDAILGQPSNQATAAALFDHVLQDLFALASHESPVLYQSGSGRAMLEAVSGLVELSPYRPFGVYVFVCKDGKMVKVENHDAVLQILFYSLQVCAGESSKAQSSLVDHLSYQSTLGSILGRHGEVELKQLEDLPLSSATGNKDINSALSSLNLSTEARLSLRAAGEKELQKGRNLAKITKEYQDKKTEELTPKGAIDGLYKYRDHCRTKGAWSYDSFRSSKDTEDFQANVKRLEAAGLWDEICEMVKQFELPDSFEVDPVWVSHGTEQRLLIEPLDIANYYRHDKGNETGSYFKEGSRPKRYRYTEKWLQHTPIDQSKVRDYAGGESTMCTDPLFWARVEESVLKLQNPERIVKEVVLNESEIEANITSSDQNLLKGDSILLRWKNLCTATMRTCMS